MNLQSGLTKELQRGFLQAAFRYPQPDFHGALSAVVAEVTTIGFVKHERVPS
jgi:hypothetical protein